MIHRGIFHFSLNKGHLYGGSKPERKPILFKLTAIALVGGSYVIAYVIGVYD